MWRLSGRKKQMSNQRAKRPDDAGDAVLRRNYSFGNELSR
jgi:hypothetical protein